jgi:hypothetical protein
MKSNKINTYDETKKLLNVIRQFSSNKVSSLINEQVEQEKSNILNINGVDVKILFSDSSDKELSNEQKEKISNLIDSFKAQVTELVKFDPGISINDRQIRLDGILTDNNNKINFTLISGDESGLYIKSEMSLVNEDMLKLLNKLNIFNNLFKETFNNILSFRYTN